MGRRAAAAVTVWLLSLGVLLWLAPPDGDDAYAHSVMAVEQVECWRQGVLWPHFHPDWNGGTGSFLPAVYAPLVLQLEGLACLAAGEGSRAAGLVLAAGLAAGTWALAWAVGRRRGGGWWAWAVAAYPLAAVLARSTTTEIWALAFAAPLIVLGMPPGPRDRREGLAVALAVAGAAGCQVGMLLMAGWVLAAGWAAAGWSGRRDAARTAGWGVAGLLLGGVFWWPTVRGMHRFAVAALVGGEYDWQRRHVFAVAANRELGPLLAAIFASLALVLLLGLAAARLRGASTGRLRSPLAALAVALFLATPAAAPVWRLVSPMAGLQFPWRFLGPATILALLVLGAVDGLWRRVGLAFTILPAALIPVALGPARPALQPGLGPGELAHRAAVRYGMAPVLPSMPGFYAPGFHPLRSLARLRRQEARVGTVDGGAFPRAYRVDVPAGGRVMLPVQYWPDLRVAVGGAPAEPSNVAGLAAVAVPGGSSLVELALGRARLRWEGVGLSALGAIVLLALSLGPRRRLPAAARGV